MPETLRSQSTAPCAVPLALTEKQREFKVEAVKLVRERGIAVKQAAREAKSRAIFNPSPPSSAEAPTFEPEKHRESTSASLLEAPVAGSPPLVPQVFEDRYAKGWS